MRYGGVKMRGLTKKGLVKSLNEANERALDLYYEKLDLLVENLELRGNLADADAFIVGLANSTLIGKDVVLAAIARFNGDEVATAEGDEGENIIVGYDGPCGCDGG